MRIPAVLSSRSGSGAPPPWIAWAGAIALIAGVWGALGWIIDGDQRRAVSAAYDDTEESANKLAHRTARALERIEHSLHLVRYLLERDGAVDLAALSRGGLLGSPKEVVISVVDAQGKLQQSTARLEPDAPNFADRDYFAKARASEGVVRGDPVFGRISKKWVIPAALKRRGEGGAFAGVVLAGFDADTLTQGYEHDHHAGTVVAVMRRDGMFLSRQSEGKRVSGEVMPAPRAAALLLPRDRSRPVAGLYDGKARFPTRVAIEGTDLIAVVSTAADARLATHSRLREALLWTGVALSLAALAGAALLARELRRARAADQAKSRVDRTHGAILNSIPAKIALLSADGRVASLNDRWGSALSGALGQLEAPMVGQPFLLVCELALRYAPSALAEVKAALRAVGSEEAESITLEHQHAGEAGGWSRLALSAATIEGTRHIVVARTNISERKAAEAALARSAGLNRMAGKAARIGGWAHDLASQVVEVSEELQALLEINEGAALSLADCEAFCAPEHREAARAGLQRCRQDGLALDTEVELVSRLGRRFWARLLATAVVDGLGAITGVEGAVQDVSERRRAEDDAAAMRAQLRAALDGMSDAFCIAGPDWRLGYLNPRTERLLVASGAQLLGGSFWLALPVDARAAFEGRWREAAASGSSPEPEAFMNSAGIWCEARAYPCEAGIAIYIRDTSGERSAQQHLRLMEACVSRMNDLVMITDNSGADPGERRIVFANEALCERSGYAREELLGARPSTLHGAETDEVALRGATDAMRAGESHRVELVHYAKSGERYWVQQEIVPVRDAEGAVSHIVAVGRDVTQIRETLALLASSNRDLEGRIAARTAQLATTNASLVEKEQEIRSVLEHMSDCVINCDRNGIVRSANSTVEALFGRAPGAVVGESVSVLIPGLAESIAARTLPRAGEPSEAPWSAVHLAGHAIEVGVSLSGYTLRDEFRVTAIVRDLRERLRALEELRQARARAEEASDAKSAFVATMSHEIRTPMNGVIGTIDLLRGTRLGPDQEQLVAMASESAHSLMDIVESVLDFSKIEAGKVEVESLEMSLRDVVEKTADLAHALADKHGVELTLFIDPSAPNRVLSDAVKIRQILLNLLSNAIKFSANREFPGRVSLRVTADPGVESPAWARFSVRDNGIGMDEGALARLFTSFSQADASTTRRFGGTGLGLTIARELARLLGGDVRVRSVLGAGSEFTVELPLTPDPSAQPAASFEHPCHCVLIGASPALVSDLRAYLAELGCGCEELSLAALAGPQIERQWPAPTVCVFVGGGDGDTVSRIRADTGGTVGHLPWIAMLDEGPRAPRAHGRGITVVKRATMTLARLAAAVRMALVLEVEADAITRANEDNEEDRRQRANVDSETHQAPSVSETLPGRALPILVAEDNEINRHVIEAQLARLGYQARMAVDGQHALDLLEVGGFSMVLTDLRMPKLDGFALVKAIRRGEAPGERIPVIALTANALKDEAERCREAGMDGYIAKPTSLATLERLIGKWVSANGSGGSTDSGAQLACPLDFDVMAETIGADRATLEEFLARFKLAASALEASIVDASRRANWAHAGDAAHQLKSNARCFGAEELGLVCEEIEEAADALRVDRMGPLLTRLQRSVREVCAHIDRWRAEQEALAQS